MITFIGDVHGKIDEYEDILAKHKSNYTIQVGDLAIGFPGVRNPKLRDNDFFITGNHDNYNVAMYLKGCLGQYGQLEIDNKKMFYVRGASSIDKNKRTIGINWFQNEELNWQQASNAIVNYNRFKPDIMISHDCPQVMVDFVDTSNTRQLLSTMWGYHKPKLWIFGHHHKSIDQVVDGCRFVCLNELETKEIK